MCGKVVEQSAYFIGQCADRSLCGAAQPVFDLCKDLLDRIEVGRVWRQEQQFRACRLDSVTHGIALVRREVIHDHNVAGAKFADKELLDIGLEDRPVHRAFDGHRSDDAIKAQGGDESGGLPVTVRGIAYQALAPRPPAVTAYHIGRRAHLINEDQPLGVDLFLVAFPEPAGQRNIAALLLTGEQAFF